MADDSEDSGFLDTLFKTIISFGSAQYQYDLEQKKDFAKRVDEKNQKEMEDALHRREEEERKQDLENERFYNSPAEQAKRLNLAGINPFYAMGGADISPHLTTTDSPSVADTYKPDYDKGNLFNPKDLVQEFFQFADFDRQQALTEAQLQQAEYQKMLMLDKIDDQSVKEETDELRKKLLEKQIEEAEADEKDRKNFFDNLGKSPWLKHGISIAKLLWQISKSRRR